MNTACVVGPGHLRADGYRHVWHGGRQWYAHRLAWVQAGRSLPDGALVLHHCDNRQCVNLDHLYAGSHADNARDRDERGHHVRPPESGAPRKLTPAQVRDARLALADGRTQREVAAGLGVSQRTIVRLGRGDTYRDVEDRPAGRPVTPGSLGGRPRRRTSSDPTQGGRRGVPTTPYEGSSSCLATSGATVAMSRPKRARRPCGPSFANQPLRTEHSMADTAQCPGSPPNWKQCGGGPAKPEGHAVTKYATLYGVPDAYRHGVPGICRGCCLDRAKVLVKAGERVDPWVVQAILDEADRWRQDFNAEALAAQNPTDPGYNAGYDDGRRAERRDW